MHLRIRPLLKLDQFRAQGHSVREIHREDNDSGSPNRRSAYERWTIPTKMSLSFLAARIESTNDSIRFWVDAGEVAAFVGIAEVARESKIPWIIGSAVFFRYYMLHLEAKEWLMLLPKPAVFAYLVGALTYKSFGLGVHHDFLRREARMFRAFA